MEKECEKLEKIPAWQLTKTRHKKEVIDEVRNEGRKVHFASLMEFSHLENSELELRCQKYKGTKNLRERSIDIKKEDEFTFPAADGTAKVSGRDYELREPAQRRERTARSEDCSRELRGEPGESQPTETKDDAEARADLLSIQGDFIQSSSQ